MESFEFTNPTRILFGRGVIQKVGPVAARYGRRCLLVTGRASARKSGLLDEVTGLLLAQGLEIVELSGILPNPRLAACHEGITLCRKHRIEVIVSLGGGSVLDTAKTIAAGAMVEGEVWDFFEKKRTIQGALPVVAIMTVAATGSEFNRITVIKNEKLHKKIGLWNEHLFPRVSLLDPELTFTLPPLQTAYGAMDIISHVLERYLNGAPPPLIQLRFKESLIRSVMEAVEAVLLRLDDYEARSTLMWAGSLACSGIFDLGVSSSDIPAHIIDTEAGGLSDHAHGAGLSVLMPAVMRFYVERYRNTAARFAEQVMRVERTGAMNDLEVAVAGIETFRRWLTGIGCPVTIRKLGLKVEDFPEIARRVDENAEGPNAEDTLGILNTYLE
jgi:alcohol dehydrogenase YqhD (iron-dependent ADH family)